MVLIYIPLDLSVWHLYVFFGKMSNLVLRSFLALIVFGFGLCVCVCVCVKLYESLTYFDSNPLLDVSFANILSYSIGFLVLLMVSFTVQQPFNLMYSSPTLLEAFAALA